MYEYENNALGWSEVPLLHNELCRIRGKRPICFPNFDYSLRTARDNECFASNDIFGRPHSCTTAAWTDDAGRKQGGNSGHVFCCPPGKPAPYPVSPEARLIENEIAAAQTAPALVPTPSPRDEPPSEKLDIELLLHKYGGPALGIAILGGAAYAFLKMRRPSHV